jgi:hypothetical protein
MSVSASSRVPFTSTSFLLSACSTRDGLPKKSPVKFRNYWPRMDWGSQKVFATKYPPPPTPLVAGQKSFSRMVPMRTIQPPPPHARPTPPSHARSYVAERRRLPSPNASTVAVGAYTAAAAACSLPGPRTCPSRAGLMELLNIMLARRI